MSYAGIRFIIIPHSLTYYKWIGKNKYGKTPGLRRASDNRDQVLTIHQFGCALPHKLLHESEIKRQDYTRVFNAKTGRLSKGGRSLSKSVRIRCSDHSCSNTWNIYILAV